MTGVDIDLPDTSTVTFINGRVSSARGLRVGVLFVRASFAGEFSIEHRTGRRCTESGTWIVEIADSEIGIISVRAFATALLIADEISRFAPELEHARTFASVERALRRVMIWVGLAQQCEARGEAIPGYREWRGIKGE